MPNAKKIIADWSETGKTVYCIIRREVDNYRLNDADGTFTAAPADPYLSLAEDSIIKGRYEVSESRTAWNNGRYTVAVYKQAGGSPAPVSDTVIGTGEMYIVSDVEIILDAKISLTALDSTVAKEVTLLRTLGLALENHVEDDIVRDGNGLKTSSKMYLYDSKANATTHDKVTGLLAKYTMTATYTDSKLTLFKVVKD